MICMNENCNQVFSSVNMGNSNTYTPNPKYTEHIELPDKVLNELELAAKMFMRNGPIKE